MSEPDVLYVPQMAAKLGRTESAIRSAVHRGGEDLPPRLKGRRIAWRRETVERWLEDREIKPQGGRKGKAKQ